MRYEIHRAHPQKSGVLAEKGAPTPVLLQSGEMVSTHELTHLALVVGLRAKDFDSELFPDASDHLFDLGQRGRAVPAFDRVWVSVPEKSLISPRGVRRNCLASRLPNKA